MDLIIVLTLAVLVSPLFVYIDAKLLLRRNKAFGKRFYGLSPSVWAFAALIVFPTLIYLILRITAALSPASAAASEANQTTITETPEIAEQRAFQKSLYTFNNAWPAYLLALIISAISLPPLLGDQKLLISVIQNYSSIGLLTYTSEPWRVLTCSFFHLDIFHLLMNMLVLLQLMPLVAKLYGRTTSVLIYFGGVILGSILSGYINSSLFSVGASGGVISLFGAALAYMLFAKDRELLSSNLSNRYRNNFFIFILVNISYGFTHSNIDHMAHLGGLIFGFIIAAILLQLPKKNSALALPLSTTVLLLVAINMFHLDLSDKVSDEYLLEIGLMKLYGVGATKDVIQGKQWVGKAAARGYAEAQFNLGAEYLTGKHMEKDYTAAKDLLLHAAYQHHKKAMYDLGLMYLKGYGVGIDYVEAYKWITLADIDNKQRDKLLNVMTSELPREYINEANARATQFRKEHDYFI